MEENNNQEEIQKNEEVVSETVVENTSSTNETNQEVKEKGIKKILSNKKVAVIGGVVVAAVAFVLIILAFLSRSPKATVKQFIGAINNKNAKKVMAIIDFQGAEAYEETYYDARRKNSDNSSKSKDLDMSDFKDNYKEVVKEYKEMDKDEKKDYKEQIKEATESMQELLDELKDEKVKVKVKVTKVNKVKGSKLLKEVKADVTVKEGKEDPNTSTMTFITMKKGLKNYIVSADILDDLL